MLFAEGKGPGTLSSWGTGEGTVSRFTVRDIRGIDAHSSAKRGRSCVRGEGWRYHSFHHARATVRSQYLPPGLEHHRQQGRRGDLVEETARILGLTVPAVKSRLLRARFRARELLTEYFKKGNAVGL